VFSIFLVAAIILRFAWPAKQDAAWALAGVVGCVRRLALSPPQTR
jgi:hypothetical protein